MSSDSAMPLPPQGQERRRSQRNSVRLMARLVCDQGNRSIGCVIRDISETGACVMHLEGAIIPTEVQLIDCENRVAYAATVIRWMPPLVALRFTARLAH